MGASDGIRPIEGPLEPVPHAGVRLEGFQLGRHEGSPGTGECSHNVYLYTYDQKSLKPVAVCGEAEVPVEPLKARTQ